MAHEKMVQNLMLVLCLMIFQGRIAHSTPNTNCSMNFTDSTAKLFSHNYPDPLIVDTECLWSIKLPPGQRVLFNMELLSPGDNQDCNTMYLEVYDGGRGAPLINKYCGYTFQESVISTGNEMYLRFVFKFAGQSNTGLPSNYRFSYTSTILEVNINVPVVAGGDVTPSLSSPLYPVQYPHNMNETWQLQAPVGHKISLLFKKFSLENSDNCAKDFVEVYDPKSKKTVLMKCGVQLSEWVQSEENTLVVKMRTDGAVTGNGFLVEYQAVPATCNNTLTTASGVLTYQPSATSCFWKVQVTSDHEILLSFDRFFFGLSDDCKGTSLSVYDGSSAAAPLTDTFCKLQSGESVKSTGNELFVKYNVAEYHDRIGFQLSYKTVAPECQNQFLNSTDGVITSPNFPNSYSSNSNCSWLVELDPQNIISLKFDTLDVEFTIGCTNDYVIIHDGPSIASPELGRFCGDMADPILSTGSSVFVQFKTDGSLTRNGFQLSYSAINTTTACDMNTTTMLTEPKGAIVSSNFPKLYPNNHDCAWVIMSQPSYQIHATFEYFELEEDEFCQNDYVSFYSDVQDNNINMIAKHCGYIRRWDIDPIVSEAEVMYIRFHSDHQSNKKGFIITYEAKETGTQKPPEELMQEESEQSIKFTLKDMELSEWEMAAYGDFKKAMAEAANQYCALNKEPTCDYDKESSFKSGNVNVLKGYPKKNSDGGLDVVFYMEYPTGNTDIVPYPVTMAILTTYQKDIEDAMGTPMHNIAAYNPATEEAQPDNTGAIVAVVVVMLVIILAAAVFAYWKFWRTGKWQTKVKSFDKDSTVLITEEKPVESSMGVQFRRRNSALRYMVGEESLSPYTPEMPRKAMPVPPGPIREQSIEIREPSSN